MLEETEKYLYIYVVDRDFGFAPNPFHGYCTLATCKPGIRNSANIGDWVIGVGGRRLKATGRCVFLMKVTEIITFHEYWTDERFELKKPLRNGSLVMMVGDNIYHCDDGSDAWIQEDSHHSNSDGTPHIKNLETDTRSVNVLISAHFFYFGSCAPSIDLASIGYKNIRNYRKMHFSEIPVDTLINQIESKYQRNNNTVMADPFNFARASERVDQATGIIS